jgi:hypothetical protein
MDTPSRLLVVTLALLGAGASRAQPAQLPPPPLLEDPIDDVDDPAPPPPEPARRVGEGIVVDGWTVVALDGPRRYRTEPPEEPACGYEQRVTVVRDRARARGTLRVRCLVSPGRFTPTSPTLEIDASELAVLAKLDDPVAADEPSDLERAQARLLDAQLRLDRQPARPSVVAPDEPAPLGALETGLLQTGIGLGVTLGVGTLSGAALVAAVFGNSFLDPSLVGCGACAAMGIPLCAGPCLVGVGETLTMNWLADRDVSLIGPVIAAYAGLVLDFGALVVAGLLLTAAPQVASFLFFTNPMIALGALSIAALLAVVPVVVFPALAYAAMPDLSLRPGPPAGPMNKPPTWRDVRPRAMAF